MDSNLIVLTFVIVENHWYCVGFYADQVVLGEVRYVPLYDGNMTHEM